MTSSRLSDTNEAVKGEIDALRDEVKRLTDLVSELAKAGSDEATRTLKTAVERAKDTASGAGETVDDIKRNLEPMAAELAANVERNPLSSLFIAAGVGMLIGLLTRSGR